MMHPRALRFRFVLACIMVCPRFLLGSVLAGALHKKKQLCAVHNYCFSKHHDTPWLSTTQPCRVPSCSEALGFNYTTSIASSPSDCAFEAVHVTGLGNLTMVRGPWCALFSGPLKLWFSCMRSSYTKLLEKPAAGPLARHVRNGSYKGGVFVRSELLSEK